MKTTKLFCKAVTVLLVVAMLLGIFASCTTSDNHTETDTQKQTESQTESATETESNAPATGATISIECAVSTIKSGENVTLTVKVEGASDKSYTWSTDSDLIKVENDTVTVVTEPTKDTSVHITATLNEDTTKTATKTLIVKAPIKEGQVGELTSDMIAELSNPSITVTGVLTDYVHDYTDSRNNWEKKYDMVVKMTEGSWAGTWNIQGNTYNKVSTFYRRGATDGLKDQNGNIGHAMEQLFINKNNMVDSKAVTNYISIPAVWEAQHLWNHLGSLDVNKFTYDPENDYYKYNIDQTSEDDLFFMTYLVYSLTPLLEDTIVDMYVVVEDGKITRLVGKTETLLYGEDSENPTGDSYTVIDLTFSDVGTTALAEPTPYEAPEYAELLAKALENMKKATNYTFTAVDTTTYSPITDDGDYSVSSVTAAALNYVMSFSGAPQLSATGTVGRVGHITEEAILFADTMMYSYTMDGKPYRTDFSGYKNNGDGSYDEFAWTHDDGGHFYGTKRINKEMSTLLPTFDFSANLFSFDYVKRNDKGEKIYYFSLLETAVTRDIAMEVSMHKYAPDAEASGSQALTIAVDENGNLLAVTFPYDLVSGTYVGYITTTFSNIGTTELEEDLFVGYVQREVRNSWDQYDVKYYHPTHTTQYTEEATADVVLRNIFGESYSDVPTPDALLEVFGDNLNGPFFDWKELGTDANGEVIYSDYIDFNTTSSNYDENLQITDYEEIIEALTDVLVNKYGFEISRANTDTSGGESGRSNRYVTFIKGDVQIVIENNFTRYFWIYIYQTGAWSLNR